MITTHRPLYPRRRGPQSLLDAIRGPLEHAGYTILAILDGIGAQLAADPLCAFGFHAGPGRKKDTTMSNRGGMRRCKGFCGAVVRLLREARARGRTGEAAARDVRERLSWSWLVDRVEPAYGGPL